MRRLLRPLFRGVSEAYGTAARLAYPWVRLPPMRITLMVTSRCNLSCPYCYIREERNKPEGDLLTEEEWGRVIETIPRRMLVMLTGGEPFIAPGIMNMLDRLLTTRHLVSVVTNGTVLDEARIKFLVDNRLRYLMCSLDGLAEYQNRVRGAGTFERVEKMFRTLNAAKRERKATYPLTCVKTTVTADNYGEIPGLLEFAEKELAVDHMSFSLLVENPLQAGFKMTGDLGDPRLAAGNSYVYPASVRPAIRKAVGQVFEYAKRSRMQIEIMPPFGRKGQVLEYIENPAGFGVRRCSIPWIEFTVYGDGRVTPCVTYEVENIRNLGYDVGKVMGHPRYRAFLAYYRKRQPYAGPCEGCCWGRHAKKNA